MTSKWFARVVPGACFAAAVLLNAIPAGAQVIYAGFAPSVVAYGGPAIAPIQTPFCTPYSYSQWVWQPGYGFVWCPVAPAAAYVPAVSYAPAVAYPPAVPYASAVAYPPVAVPFAPAVAFAPSVAPVPYYTGYSSSAFLGAAVGLGVLGLIASAANQPVYAASPFLPSVAFAAPYPAFAAYSYYPGFALAAANPAFAFAPAPAFAFARAPAFAFAPAFARVNNITNVRRVTVVRNVRFFHRPVFVRPARFAGVHPALFRGRFAAVHPARFAAAHPLRFVPGRNVVASAPRHMGAPPRRMAAPTHFATGRSFAPGPRPMMPQRMAQQSRGGAARPMMAAPRGRPPR
jgi:hypothetical protein